MLDFIIACLIVIIGVPAFFITLILLCVATGSNVDPDDNGLFKSKKKKEAWRQEKMNRINNS